VRFNHRFASPILTSRSPSPFGYALCRYAHPFEQQKQLVRQHFRLREGGCGAQRRRKTTVTKIVVLTALALAFVAFGQFWWRALLRLHPAGIARPRSSVATF
jgi:hypothetical protein